MYFIIIIILISKSIFQKAQRDKEGWTLLSSNTFGSLCFLTMNLSFWQMLYLLRSQVSWRHHFYELFQCLEGFFHCRKHTHMYLEKQTEIVISNDFEIARFQWEVINRDPKCLKIFISAKIIPHNEDIIARSSSLS
jgi:hypothetical protein